MGLQAWKDKHGIGISGSKAKRKREDKARKVNTTRAKKNNRGRTTGKEYWNPISGKWQSTPVRAPVTKDHLGRNPEVGAAARKSVRQNPVSDETLKKVRESMANKKSDTKDNDKDKTNGNSTNKKIIPSVQKKDKVKIQSNNKPKIGGGAKQIRKRLTKAGFKPDELENIGKKHQAWKAARKAGTLGDWEEKYHPGRGRYKNKLKIEKKKNGGK